ncbi:MAG: Protein TolB [Segetibacter sp.]|nr:Protein TolB [Segetibacter sp.]
MNFSIPFRFLLLFCCVTPVSLLQAQSSFEKIGNIKRITNVIDSYPMLSHDGKKIVFQSNRTGDWEIFSMTVDGKNLKQLTNSAGPDLIPVWSPDDSKIVFASERDNDSEIYIMNSDGSNQKRLTTTPGDDSHPHWFPDGSRIIFNSAQTSPDLKIDWSKQYHEIFSIKPDGTDVKQITHFKTVCTYPSVSPDGSKIAFRKVIPAPGLQWDLSPSNNNSEVFVMDMNGENILNLSNNAAFDGWPWWSADGKRVVFSSNRAGPENVGQLYSVNVDGTQLERLTNTSYSIAQPNCTKDGKYIYAYQSWENNEYEYGNIISIELMK